MNVSIVGYGWVGKAMHKVFPNASIYDPIQNYKDESAFAADFVFICVPTPSRVTGTLDCSIVAEVIGKCSPDSIIILRSTVNPGFCEEMAGKGHKMVMMPEYLGETVAHPLFDETKTSFFIIGGAPEYTRAVIELYQSVYNAATKIRQVTLLEAEVIKLSENRAIAFKMMQCQELYDVCQKAGIDYYTIREAVYGDDPRFNMLWTFVFPEKRGFNNSKCLQKDVPAWCAWAETVGIDPVLTKSLVNKSNEYESQHNNPK